MAGIYVIDVHDGNRVDIIDRYVVVGESTREAAEKAAGYQWPSATKEAADSMIEDRLDVGRLGDYNPGNEGAAMSRGAVIAVQRIGQR